MGRIRVILFLLFLGACGLAFGEAPKGSNNQSVYSQYRYDYDLTSNEDLCFVRVVYEPAGSSGSLQRVTGLEFVDKRPANFNGIHFGYIAGGPGAKTSCYVIYSFPDDTVIFANTNKNSVVLNAFNNMENLNTRDKRQQAFDELKGFQREDGHNISFDPMVSVSTDIILDVLKPFVTNGFVLGVSVVLIALFIREKFLARKKNLIKLEGRENRALAKDNGLKRKVVERLRDDYAVLDKSVRRSTSFADYVGLHKKEFSKAK